MPKVSIITTTYRHQDFIAYTIQSILDQTFIDWELLIWDDSPDNETWEVIQTYVKEYPEKIKARHHSPNKWIADNVNYLVDKVSKDAEYVAFLEWDDIFIPDNLEKKIHIFKKYPELWMVYNNLDFIDADGKIFYKNFLRKAPFYLKNEKLSKSDFMKNETFYGSYSTLMIKKKCLDEEPIKNPTNDKVFSVSDRDLFFRISNKYKCYWIQESLTLYRRHNTSVSRNNLKIFDDLEIQINEYLKNWFIDKKLFNSKISFISILKSVSYIETKNKKKAFQERKKAFKYNFRWNFIYKLAILFFLIIPYIISKKILTKIIKRG